MILEPQAVGDLVQLVTNYAGARQADEGRSPFSKQGVVMPPIKVHDFNFTSLSDAV